MDVLIAYHGEAPRKGLAKALSGRGYELLEVAVGDEALGLLLAHDAPRVALVDWDLPGIDGPELCRLVRDFHLDDPPYIILLAAGPHHDEVALGLESGANDCVRTPVAADELRARVEMGRRFVELPWGRRDAAAVPTNARPGDAPEHDFGAGLTAFMDADAVGDEDPGGEPARLEALIGDRWQMA